MKNINVILLGGLASTHGELNLALKDLSQLGVNPKIVQELFQQKANVFLNWDETLKVSADEEGKDFSFSSLDGISIVVPIHMASGPFNKGDSQKD